MLSYVNARYIWLRWEDRAFYLSGGSRPFDKGVGRSQNNFFSALRASVWSKNKGRGAGPLGLSPGSATVRQSHRTRTGFFYHLTGAWLVYLDI